MAQFKKGVPFSEFTREDVDKFRTAYVRSVLRNASLKWPARYLADKKSSVGWNQKRCTFCKRLIPSRLRKLDHVEPVVDPAQGFVSWDLFIMRLFTYTENWQVLCPKCHADKTAEERKAHVERRKREKALLPPKEKKPRKPRAKNITTPPDES